ncbi:hypothetical protein L1277_002190 [Okibacterium sp. HSC-33S16]|uniref:hypothetical protein n=1 Tax=Okibacterium sp. HSC-33S16 TaxID=2910965 RepID=UPI0020A0B38E|nr:hypothetical protein [Okibacterium sp. HSC-33S16]MCP2032091.1 hypothetical protein [Okibacterium sp. HSC-33S16]
MERRSTDSAVALPLSASSFALALIAALCFLVSDTVGFLSEPAEALFIVTWLAGWVSVVWATLLGAGGVFLLIRRAPSGQSVSRAEVALIVGAFLIIIAVVVSHPLWGSGSAVG